MFSRFNLRIYPRYIRFIRRYHWAVLLAAIVLTAYSAFYVQRLHIEGDFAALLPKSYTSVKTLNKIIRKMGGSGNLLILIECDDLARSKALAADLHVALERSKVVNFVDYKIDKDFFRRNIMLYADVEDLDKIREEIEERLAFLGRDSPVSIRRTVDAAGNPRISMVIRDVGNLGGSIANLKGNIDKMRFDFPDIERELSRRGFEEYYTSQSKRYLAMVIYPNGGDQDILAARRVFSEVTRIVDSMRPRTYHPSIRVHYGGTLKNRIDEIDTIMHDLKSTSIYTILLIVLLISIYFRQIFASFFIGIPLFMGLLWTFATAYGAIGNLNIFTASLFLILFGLGIVFGIHMFSRYLEERRARVPVDKALVRMLSHTGAASMTSAFTTSAAFFSLTINDFEGFSKFGFIAGTGVTFCLAAMFIILPALICLGERYQLLTIPRPRKGATARKQGRFPFARPVLAGSLILTLISVLVATRIGFEYDFQRLGPNLSKSKRINDKINEIFDLSLSPAVVIAKSDEELEAIVDAVNDKIEADRKTPTIKTIKTIKSFLPSEQLEKMGKIEKIRQLVSGDYLYVISEELKRELKKFQLDLQVEPLEQKDLPKTISLKFHGVDGGKTQFAFIYPSVSLYDGKKAMDFAQDVKDIETKLGTYHASSPNIIFADMLEVITRDGKIAVFFTLLVVFLIVLLDFRNLTSAILVLIPLVCGTVWTLGVMYFAGIDFNFYNIIVIPTVIGIGVDNGVHLLHRYREEGARSLPHVMVRTGGAILITSAITMAGFSGLVFAKHSGLNSIGLLAITGIGLCLVASLSVLPAILQLRERSKGRQRLRAVRGAYRRRSSRR